MRTFAVYFFGVCLLSSCSTSTKEADLPISDRAIRAVATTSIVTDLVKVIGGTDVEIESLMGPGVDPHLYNASARDISRMTEADIIVYNGLHLEGEMGDLFEQMKQRGSLTIAVAEIGVPDSLLITSDLFQANYDPHVWLDAKLWARSAHALAITLGTLDPERAERFLSRASEYTVELMEVNTYVLRKADEIPQEKRILVTSHDAFGYFGRAYGFEVYGLQGLSTTLEAGLADVQNLASMVAERRIPAMFIETSVSPRGIEAVLEAVKDRGFEVKISGPLYGDSLDHLPDSAATYLGMIRYNIDMIARALSDAERS